MALTMLPPSAAGARGLKFAVTSGVVHAEGTRTVVALRGEADVATRAHLSDVLSRVIALGTEDLLIDLAEVTFIDTAAVQVLATGQWSLDRAGRRMTFRSPSRLATLVLQVCGLDGSIETREGAPL